MTTTTRQTGLPTLDVTLHYSHTIGRAEFSGPGFRNPTAMARGEGNVIYVANRSYDYRPDGKRITMCTVDEEFIGEFAKGVFDQGDGEAVSTDGAIIWPTAIVVGPDENVYLADEYLDRISIYSPDGEYLSKWERPGTGDGEWNNPSGLAFGADGRLYVVDSANHPGADTYQRRRIHLPVGRIWKRPRPVQHAVRHLCRFCRQRVRSRLAQRPHPEVYR